MNSGFIKGFEKRAQQEDSGLNAHSGAIAGMLLGGIVSGIATKELMSVIANRPLIRRQAKLLSEKVLKKDWRETLKSGELKSALREQMDKMIGLGTFLGATGGGVIGGITGHKSRDQFKPPQLNKEANLMTKGMRVAKSGMRPRTGLADIRAYKPQPLPTLAIKEAPSIIQRSSRTVI